MATGSIRVKKTKDGEVRYQVTVEGDRDPVTGKRNRVFKNVSGSKKEANAVMHELINEMDKGKAIKKSTSISVGEWMDQWLEMYLPNIEETTRVGYRTKIHCYIRPALGNIKLASLKTVHIQKMVNDMIEQGLSPKNIRDTYVNVNSAMKQAVKLRMIAYNPCEGVTLPKRKKYKSNVYDTEMISKLLDLARGTDIYIPILLCVSAGLRRGEMLALGWDNVDFEKGIISIQRNLVRGEDGYIIKAPKSESGIRDIHLGREVMEELRKAKVQHFSQMMESGIAFNQKYNFVVRQDDGSPFTPDAMTRKWKRFITRHKLPNIRLHDLRHSHATALIKAGVNPRVVQERLGHADVSITLNTYTHVLPEMDIEAAEKIDNMILKKA